MKFLLLLLSFFFLYVTDVSAQTRKSFKINPGEKVVETIPKEEVYTYPEFRQGKVCFRNDGISEARMNYNSLYAEMQFIDPRGDTLSVANEGTIKLIAINADTFYYSSGYLKLITEQGKVKLARKTFIDFNNRQKLNGFGEASSGSAETYGAIANKSYLKELIAMEILTLVKYNELYIGDKFNNFKLVNKKNLLDAYSSREKEVEAYLKENKVNFSNEEDIKQLIIHFKAE